MLLGLDRKYSGLFEWVHDSRVIAAPTDPYNILFDTPAKGQVDPNPYASPHPSN